MSKLQVTIWLLTAYCLRFGNALECYACDSAEDAECATSPGQQISVEDCNQLDDECVTVIVAGNTRRGCRSRLFPTGYCPEPCDRCGTNLCNRNVFPADRLRCYQCSGAACADVSGAPAWLLPCPVYYDGDRCYTNIIGMSNVRRGCERTSIPADCPNVCLKCNYDGCNNELAISTQSCLECKHAALRPNPSCLRNQKATEAWASSCAASMDSRCTNKVMHGHTSKCYSYINQQTDVVERGCSSTKPFYPSGNLTECYGENCNDNCYSIACNRCTSGADGPGCRSGQALRAEECAARTQACYSCERGARLRRGCADDTFEQMSGEACSLCRDSDGCNRFSVRTCYHCSSLENAECAQTLDDTVAEVQQRNCTHANELCVSTLVTRPNAVYTLRGCASHVPECTEHNALCARCNGSLCNTDPIASWYTANAASGVLLSGP